MLVIIVIGTFIFGRDIVNAREEIISIQDSLSIDVIRNSNYMNLYPISDEQVYTNLDSIILEISNNSDKSINYLIGNKNQNFPFLLWLSDDIMSYEHSNIKYSFLVVEE